MANFVIGSNTEKVTAYYFFPLILGDPPPPPLLFTIGELSELGTCSGDPACCTYNYAWIKE